MLSQCHSIPDYRLSTADRVPRTLPLLISYHLLLWLIAPTVEFKRLFSKYLFIHVYTNIYTYCYKFSPHPFRSGKQSTTSLFCYCSTPDPTTPTDFLPASCESPGKWKLSQGSASNPEFLAVTLHFPQCLPSFFLIFWPSSGPSPRPNFV